MSFAGAAHANGFQRARGFGAGSHGIERTHHRHRSDLLRALRKKHRPTARGAVLSRVSWVVSREAARGFVRREVPSPDDHAEPGRQRDGDEARGLAGSGDQAAEKAKQQLEGASVEAREGRRL